MAYGRYRYSRRRFGRRRRTRYPYQKRAKARQNYNKRRVKARAKNIQSATKAPMSRLVLFEDCRSYIVEDNSGDALVGPEPIERIFDLNNPQNAFPTGTTPVDQRALQGTWTASDFAAKGHAMPGVSKWVCNKDGTGEGAYRFASATSTKVTVTAHPIDEDEGTDPKKYQAVTRLICKKVTKLSDATKYMGVPPSTSFNVDQMARQPYTRSADMYRVDGGANKGATITTNYSFKRLNRGRDTTGPNHFFANSAPTELDFLHLLILPTSADYTLNNERCGKFRVVIKMETIVQLSEPNTDGSLWGESDGNTFERIKRTYTSMMDNSGPGDDE